MITTLVLMSLVTWFPRVLPVALFADSTFHPLLVRWLKFVPVAVLSAMLATSVFYQGDQLAVSFHNLPLMVSVATFIVAYFSQSMFVSVFFGMLLLALLRGFLGS